MVDESLLKNHPYVPDVLEWLHERRRFSNIRHPFRKDEFEKKILDRVCSSLSSELIQKVNQPLPSTNQLLSQPNHLLGYVGKLLESHPSQSEIRIEIKKAWLTPEDRIKFAVKLEALLAEFEQSTSKFGEPVSIVSIQTAG